MESTALVPFGRNLRKFRHISTAAHKKRKSAASGFGGSGMAANPA
jgi:hypothetical protein